MTESSIDQKGSAFLAILIGTIFGLILIGLFWYSQKQPEIQLKAPSAFSQKSNSSPTCKIYTYEDRGYSFFPIYTVKTGDSLLSVARDQLGSVARIGDLIEMNKTKYPSVLNQSSFLEVGWRLLLPPKEVSEVPVGGIRVTQGILLTDAEADTLRINVSGSRSPSIINFYPNRSVKTVIQQGVQKGSCINIVSGYMNTKPVFSITLQE